MKKLIKEALYEDFISQANNELKSVYKQEVDMYKPAQTWGGCFTSLPEHVTFLDVRDLVRDYKGCNKT